MGLLLCLVLRQRVTKEKLPFDLLNRNIQIITMPQLLKYLPVNSMR